ncbi:MAG: hypothetical protein AAGE52_28745 [Myxococcota bacterium]
MRWLMACVVLWSCGGDPWKAITREPARTEVVIIGSLHRVHLHDEDYPMRILEALIRAAEPEVVVAEIPPAGFARVSAAHAAEEEDPWLTSFPELSAVVFPLHDEFGFELVPGSGWRRAMTDEWTGYWERHPSGPEEPLFQQVWTHRERRLGEEGADPMWIHSPTYRNLTQWGDNALATHADLGEADPLRVCRAHAVRVDAAIRAHEGKRIAVVFDARRRWCLERAVRELPGVVLHDTRALIDTLE